MGGATPLRHSSWHLNMGQRLNGHTSRVPPRQCGSWESHQSPGAVECLNLPPLNAGVCGGVPSNVIEQTNVSCRSSGWTWPSVAATGPPISRENLLRVTHVGDAVFVNGTALRQSEGDGKVLADAATMVFANAQAAPITYADSFKFEMPAAFRLPCFLLDPSDERLASSCAARVHMAAANDALDVACQRALNSVDASSPPEMAKRALVASIFTGVCDATRWPQWTLSLTSSPCSTPFVHQSDTTARDFSHQLRSSSWERTVRAVSLCTSGEAGEDTRDEECDLAAWTCVSGNVPRSFSATPSQKQATSSDDPRKKTDTIRRGGTPVHDRAVSCCASPTIYFQLPRTLVGSPTLSQCTQRGVATMCDLAPREETKPNRSPFRRLPRRCRRTRRMAPASFTTTFETGDFRPRRWGALRRPRSRSRHASRWEASPPWR